MEGWASVASGWSIEGTLWERRSTSCRPVCTLHIDIAGSRLVSIPLARWSLTRRVGRCRSHCRRARNGRLVVEVWSGVVGKLMLDLSMMVTLKLVLTLHLHRRGRSVALALSMFLGLGRKWCPGHSDSLQCRHLAVFFLGTQERRQ